MTQVHPGINIGLQYIEEYISKLHIHQHSLLTRKVFFSTQFSALVFFSVSAGSSRLQVIFVFKSSSSLDLDHHSIRIITGHHHWIWIITGSGSSLDLDHHWASSLDLDHHSIQIITAGSSSLDHHGCYLMILLITGSYTEPSLFHAGCRPRLHAGISHCLYLTLSHNGPSITYI